jgi:hypothetical protein
MINIFTIASDKNKLIYLEKSAELFDLHINYFMVEKWGKNLDKINYMASLIEDLPDDSIVCFIDAYDVIVNSTQNDILEKFLSLDCDILISTETNCYPSNFKVRYDELVLGTITKYKYINSGGYIGYKKPVLDLLRWKNINLMKNKTSDQGYFYEYYLNNYQNNKIKLDFDCIIFHSMYKIPFKNIEIVNNRIYNNELKNYSCFLHFNGQSYLNKNVNIMEKLLENRS